MTTVAAAETRNSPRLTGSARPFHVLAFDGGGVRGIFTAALLAGLEEDTGLRVVDHFDLVVGTSTGGIIALALGAGLTPREILEFYVAERDEIFPGPRALTSVRRVFAAKYRPDGLERALKRILGERLLGESRIPLVIPSYNLGGELRLSLQDPAPQAAEARPPPADVGGRHGN